jgi:hypothetical protein
MPIRTVLDTYGDDAVLVEKMLGNSYQIVRYVAQQMAYIKSLSDNMTSIVNVSDSIENISFSPENIATIEDILDELDKLTVVHTNIDSVVDVGESIVSVNAISDKLTVLEAIYDNLTEIILSAPGTKTLDTYRYVATTSQTVFNGADANGNVLAYTASALIVTVNGVTMAPNNYTASNGTSVVFSTGLTAGDVVVIHSFGMFAVADSWRKNESDARYARIGDAWTKGESDARFPLLNGVPFTAAAAAAAGAIRHDVIQYLSAPQQTQARANMGVTTANIGAAALAGATFTGGINGTTGQFSGVVIAAAATDPSHLLNRGTADARYERITTSPTALTSGQVIPGTESGRFYSMALPDVQTCALPSITGLPDGFSVVLRATGVPSSFQSSYVHGNGQQIYYMGANIASLVMVGYAEIFRFTWFNGLGVWVAECLAQPLVNLIASYGSTVNAWNPSPSAWAPLPSYGNNPAAATNYQFLSNHFQVAAAGLYNIMGHVQYASGAGGLVSGVGYLAGGTNSGADFSRGFAQTYYNTADNDGSTMCVNWTERLQPGDMRVPYFFADPSGIYTYLSGNFSIIRLIGR